MIRVLVSGAGGDVGQGIIKSLEKSALEMEVYTTCVFEDSAWLHRNENSFIAPYSNDPNYIPFLIRLIQKYSIDLFIPGVDSEITIIAAEKNRIEQETGTKVFGDDAEITEICDDKYATAEFLKKHNLPVPDTVLASDPHADEFIKKQGFPLIVKKRRGRGSVDVMVAHGYQEVSRFLGNEEYMFQEYLDPKGGEYTSGIYLGDDKEVKGICTFQRELKCGSTFKARRILDPLLESSLEKIAQTLGAKYLNIQSMRRGDILFPFEFNGRFSGTTGIISRVFNAPEMYIRERILGEKQNRVENRDQFVVMRYYDEIYTTPENIDALHRRSQEI